MARSIEAFRHFHQHLKGLLAASAATGTDADAASVQRCLTRFAAELRRECDAGHISNRFIRGNALGLARIIEALVAPMGPLPDGGLAEAS